MATPIPDNRAAFRQDELSAALGGRFVPGTPDAARELAAQGVVGVTTDSRRTRPGELFVALRGESFDGHRFVETAVRAGARAVVVEERAAVDVPQLVVEDTLDALGALARLHRQRWGGRLVAVAGSAGKTTTRRVTARLVAELFPGKVHTSVGNLNNRVGVPMVLFGLAPEHEVAVVEIGTNLRGEVRALTEVALPDVGVLTLIDLEHAQGIGDLDAVEEEEGDLLAGLPSAAAAVVNGDDARVLRQLGRARVQTELRYGFAPHNELRAQAFEPRGPAGASFDVVFRGSVWARLESTLLGKVGVSSALAALGVASSLLGALPDVALAKRCFGASDLREPGRLTPIGLGGDVLVIDDSYNANPTSVRAALETAAELARARSRRLVLVLGEMRELGDFSEGEHRGLGEAAARCGAGVLFGVAGDARWLVEAASAAGLDSEFFSDTHAASRGVLGAVKDGDVVLVKASRGVHAEHIVEALVEARGRAA